MVTMMRMGRTALTPATLPPRGEGPFGPPPPRPVNEPSDRSRSPQRHEDQPGDSASAPLRLSTCLPPPSYNMDQQIIQLPQSDEVLAEIGRVWDPGWIASSLPDVSFKEPTVKAVASMSHWSDLLRGAGGARWPEVHLNSDGSWNEEKGIGGYAVAAVLVLAGAQSIFGFWGEQTHGAADTPWTSSTAPALHNDEQVALATSLLWVLQSRAFLEVTKYVLHYDCLSAGKAITGEWRPLNDLGSRSHHGTPDKNGRDFTGVADQCHLWLPATLHDGTDVTYRQANGAGHRIDYIALGGLATVASLRSWVDVSFDTLAPNEDHDPVVLNSVGWRP